MNLDGIKKVYRSSMAKFFSTNAIDQLNALNLQAKEQNVSLEELVM